MSRDRLDEVNILRLSASYETLGVLIEFLAGMEPFAHYDLGNFSRALQLQLQEGDHLAALSHDRMVGYCGWLRTSEKAAEAWQAGTGNIAPVPASTIDTAVLTVVAARDRGTLYSLLARAQAMNPFRRIFFKREYALARQPRKRVVDTAGLSV